MGRIVVVGDIFQSIYSFRGADIDAIPSLVQMLTNRSDGCVQFPLSVCRRCPKSHIRLANALVPDIQAMSVENSGTEASEGEIYQVNVNIALDMMQEGDMGLGRVNKVLIPAAYQLIRMRKKVVIRGRDIGTGLIAVIKKMRAKSIEDLLRKIQIWFQKEVKKLCVKEGVTDPTLLEKNVVRFQSIDDTVCCIEALCEGVEKLDELISTIEKLFADFDDDGKPKQAIILGTVHRTKGLEAHNVFVLDPENFPHKLARKPWERVQERNLAYVAVTRSKFLLGEDGSVIEPGRLFFIGVCPKIFKAHWLTGLQRYPEGELPEIKKPEPPPPKVIPFFDRPLQESRLIEFYKKNGFTEESARSVLVGLNDEAVGACVKTMEDTIAKESKPPEKKLTKKQLKEEKRYEAMLRAVEEANF